MKTLKNKNGIKEEMLELVELFLVEKINIDYFCVTFERIFNFSEKINNLSPSEKLSVENLFDVAALYTPYPEDRKVYQGYSDENAVRQAAQETFDVFLNKNNL